MKRSAIILCCCAAAVGGAIAGFNAQRLLTMTGAKFYLPLQAEYTITGRNLVDPLPEDKKDRIAIYIGGESARQLHKAMLVPEKSSDACGTSLRSKVAGGLECTGNDKEGYTCGVAIMLDDGTTKNAFDC